MGFILSVSWIFNYPLLSKTKKSIPQWERYQQEKANKQTICDWWKKSPNANIAIVTGKISNLAVVDVDKGANINNLTLPPTAMVQTGGEGWHHYYKYPANKKIASKIAILPKIDIKADGGYVIAPPSIHASGKIYRWQINLEDCDLVDFPFDTFSQFSKNLDNEPRDWANLLKGVPDGQRNVTATSIAGKLLKHLPQNDWQNVVWPALKGWNLQNNPPLDEKELWKTFQSIAKSEIQKRNKTQNDNIKILSWSDFDKVEFPKERWRVENLIPLEGRVIIAAPSGEKKSWVAMAMAQNIAAGTPFLGHSQFATKQGSVLYVENETPQYDMQRRGRQLGFHTVGQHIWYLNQDSLNFNDQATIQQLAHFVDKCNIKVIFVDTLRSVSGGLKEEKAEEVRLFFNRFKSFTNSGIAIIFIDHCRKPQAFESKARPKKEQVLGSQDKVAAVEGLIMLRSDQDSDLIFIYSIKNKAGKEFKPFKIQMADQTTPEGEKTILTYAGEIKEQILKIAQAKEYIFGYLQEQEQPADAKTIIKAIGGKVGKSNIEKALLEMREKEEIQFEKKGNKFLYWPTSGEDIVEEPDQLFKSS